MHSFADTIEIAADVQRVWRALTIPAEVVSWDAGVVEALDAPPDYPRVGQHIRWRYPLGPLSLILHDRPNRVETCSLLCADLRLGPFDFAETYTLCEQGSSATRLTAELLVSSSIPIVGAPLLLFVGQPLARSTVRSSLAAIKQHCELPG